MKDIDFIKFDIVTMDDNFFYMNGKKMPKIYKVYERSLKENVLIYNVSDDTDVLLRAKIEDITVDGETFNSIDELIEKLAVILFKKGGGGASGGLTEDKANTLYRRIDKSVTLIEGQKLIGKVGEKEYKIAETKKLDDGSGDYVDIGDKNIPLVSTSSERPTTDIAGVKHQNAFLEDIMDIIKESLVGSSYIEVAENLDKKIQVSLKGDTTSPNNKGVVQYISSRIVEKSGLTEVRIVGQNFDKVKEAQDKLRLFIYKEEGDVAILYAESWKIINDTNMLAFFSTETLEKGEYIMGATSENKDIIGNAKVIVTGVGIPTSISTQNWKYVLAEGFNANKCIKDASSVTLTTDVNKRRTGNIISCIGDVEIDITKDFSLSFTLNGTAQNYNNVKTLFGGFGIVPKSEAGSIDKDLSIGVIFRSTKDARPSSFIVGSVPQVLASEGTYMNELQCTIDKVGRVYMLTVKSGEDIRSYSAEYRIEENCVFKAYVGLDEGSLDLITFPIVSVSIDTLLVFN